MIMIVPTAGNALNCDQQIARYFRERDQSLVNGDRRAKATQYLFEVRELCRANRTQEAREMFERIRILLGI